MDRPLGTHIGNALEIIESVQILQGLGPADTRALTCRLGGEMLRLAGVVPTLAEGESRIARSLDDGSAMAKFRELVHAHGGNVRVCDDPQAILPRAPIVLPLPAWRSGFVTRMDSLEVGLAAVRLGAGRNRIDDQVDPSVGFVLVRKPGDAVQDGEPLVFVHASTEAKALAALTELRAAVEIGPAPVALMPLWLDVVY